MKTQDTCEPHHITLADTWTSGIVLVCKKHGIIGYLNGITLVKPEIIVASLRGIFYEHVKEVSGQKIVEETINSLPIHLL